LCAFGWPENKSTHRAGQKKEEEARKEEKKEIKARRNHFCMFQARLFRKCIRKCSLHRALDAGSTWPKNSLKKNNTQKILLIIIKNN
jgi:hypothetical protein